MDLEVIDHKGELKILEIDARFPSQTPIVAYHGSGINYIEELYDLFTKGRFQAKQINKMEYASIEHLLFKEDSHNTQSGQLMINKNNRFESHGEHIMTEGGIMGISGMPHCGKEPVSDFVSSGDFDTELISDSVSSGSCGKDLNSDFASSAGCGKDLNSDFASSAGCGKDLNSDFASSADCDTELISDYASAACRNGNWSGMFINKGRTPEELKEKEQRMLSSFAFHSV